MAVGDVHDIALTMSALQETNEVYQIYEDEWSFLQAAYNGAKDLVAYGAIIRHERESQVNYDRRIDEAYGFSYSKSVVELFNFYLFKEAVQRDLGKLAKDKSWELFTKDCNLESDDFDEFLLRSGKSASIQGQCGILVDKPNTTAVQVKSDEIAKRAYPYVSLYKSLAILDWEYERDEFNRPRLTYLKVKDDDDLYRLWYLDRWEIWKEPETEESKSTKVVGAKGETQAEKIAEGTNPLGEIPWVWLYNSKTSIRGLGISDISDVARIDASIMRNLSEIEEVITYGAFPMMRKPKPEAGQSGLDNDEVGIAAILEFDPEHPDSKPDWLEAAVAEPIDAILKVIGKKIEEIYRTANAGGMAAMEVQTNPKSGTALKAEFQLLNAKLVSKGILLEKAELEIIRFWLMWQNQSEWYEDVVVERAETYEVENLAQNLENLLTSTAIVTFSDTFNKKVQKKAARLVLSGETDDEMSIIDKEIDDYEPPEFDFDMGGEGGDFGVGGEEEQGAQGGQAQQPQSIPGKEE